MKKAWQQANLPRLAARSRETYLEKTYGLTPDQYQAMLDAQNGLCAICHEAADHKLHVDHSHQTGKVRGLLCFRCNTALGNFRDSTLVLESAAKYLHERS
jgi:hypothetical protein